MVSLCTTLWFLHCVIGYTYVLVEKELLKVQSGTYYCMVGDAYAYATF
jgi:hypothetical protein